MESGRLGFFAFKRDQEDFISNEGVCVIPEKGQSHFRVDFNSSPQLQLFWYLVSSSMKTTLYRAVQYGLFVGALGTLVHIVEDLAVQNSETDPWTKDFGTNMSRVISDFSGLPALLIVFKVMSQMARWSAWLGHGGSICGRLGDLSLILGSLVGTNDDQDVNERERVRKLQFKFYRYLNAIHCISYWGLDARLPSSAIDTCNELCRIGLLTDDEAIRIARSERGGMHATLLTWVSALWHNEIEERQVEGDNHPNSSNFHDKLMSLRTEIACLQGASDYDREPDVTNSMLYAVTYLLLFFVAITYPAALYSTYESDVCLQPWSCLSAAIFFITYDGLLSMQRILERSPFDINGDCVNLDSLLCGMEEVTFHMIRATYDVPGCTRSLLQGAQPEAPQPQAHVTDLSVSSPSGYDRGLNDISASSSGVAAGPRKKRPQTRTRTIG
jgi:hypothetical protein